MTVVYSSQGRPRTHRRSRAAWAADAQRLRAQGLSITQVAAELGLSRSFTGSLLYDHDGAKERERKRRYAGVCEQCGARTDGSNGRAKAPSLCAACSVRRQHEERFWTRDAIVDCIQAFAEMYGRPPTAPDWNPSFAAARGDTERAARFREDGAWPFVSVVVREFGSWAAAIEAAGFPRPLVGRYERTPETRAKASASHRGRPSALRGRGRNVELILAELRHGPRSFSELVRACDRTPDLISDTLRRLLRYGLVERPSRGVYQLPGWSR